MNAFTTACATALMAILAALALSASPNLDRLDAHRQAANVNDAQKAAQHRAHLVAAMRKACGSYAEYADGSFSCKDAK